MTFSKRTAGLLGATALVVAGLTMSTGGSAEAASTPCGSWAHGTDDTYIPAHTTTSGDLKVEPAAECADGQSFPDGSNIDVYCYTMNYYGNEWLYVHQIVGDTNGWILASDVDYNSGATAPHC